MRLSTALTLTLVALLLVFPVGVIGASSAFATSSAFAAADGQPNVQSHSLPQSQQAPQPDDPQQVITIRLTEDGNAEWTIESRYLLEDEDETETFRTFADAVIAGDRDIDYDRETFEHFRWSAQSGIDRQMELTNTSWDEPRVENRSEIALETDGETDTNDDTRIGVISYSFTWTNFTEKDGNRIYLGDVFEHDDGTWFPRLVDSQRLVIVSPSNYGYEQVSRAPTDGKLVWDGPYEFDEGELSVTYLEGAPIETETPEENSPILSRSTLGLGLLILFMIIGAGGFFMSSWSSTSDTDGTDGTEGAEAKVAGPAADESSEAETETVNGAAVTGTAGGNETDTTTYDEADSPRDVDLEDDVDLELLSDEERVHRLLRRNSGRMKQASIVKETGWSNAKVSQLLSKMDEDEEIEKLRIGRENLITHPEVDPTEIE